MFVNAASKPKFVDLPFGDKSITHRALIAAALSDCTCKISNAAINADTFATMDCLEALGAKFSIVMREITVTPILTRKSGVVLDCKNSGTTARLLAGVVAGLGVEATFVGDQSLSKRPMDRVLEPLKKMGLVVEKGQGILFKLLPSQLIAIDYEMPVASAQVKSAILFAGLSAFGKTVVREKIKTRNHTENILNYFGADIEIEDGYIAISPCFLKAKDVVVPNDFSTAAYLIVAGLNSGIKIKNVGLNPTRTQFLELLKNNGAKITVKTKKSICGEPIGDISVGSKNILKPFCVNAEQSAMMIDEIPIACLAAAMAKGRSIFEGVGELAFKESDRINSTTNALKALGIQAGHTAEEIIIVGRGAFEGGQLPESDDHRIAMLGVVGGLLSKNGADVPNTDCINISCPNFLQILGNPICTGLIGTDIQHSFSPQMYELIGETAKISISYQLLQCSEKGFKQVFLDASKRLDGVNLTMPFKTMANKSVISNTVSFVAGRSIFYNTDGEGVFWSLFFNKIVPKGLRLLVIGCGGAAISATKMLVNDGAMVTVRNRTANKVEKLKTQIWLTEDKGVFDGILSFVPVADALVCVTEEEIKHAAFVFDAYYFSKTELVKTAKKHRVKVVQGLDMLFWQAVQNVEIWTGKSMTFSEKKACYLEYERKKQDGYFSNKRS